VRAGRVSGPPTLGEGAANRLGGTSGIRGVHDRRDHGDAGDTVAGENARVFRCDPSNRENGEPRTVDHGVEDVHRKDAFLRLRRAGDNAACSSPALPYTVAPMIAPGPRTARATRGEGS